MSKVEGRRLVVPRRIGALVVLLVITSACGTRLPDEAFDETSEVVTTGEGVEAGPEGAAGDPASDGATADDGGESTTGGGAGGGGGSGETAAGDEGSGIVVIGATGPNEASDVGVTATTIRIGNITAENGVLGDAFAPAVRGLRAWVQHTNANGGIHGRQIELFTCDDREDRARSLECARRLVEQDKVFALFATNSRALGGAAQYLHDQKVPVIGFPITNSYYRYPRFFSLYEDGTYARDGKTVGYKGEVMYATGIYRWLRQNLKISKAAVFAYDIDESRQAGDAFAEGMELEGFNVTKYVVSFAAPSFDQAVADMQRKGIELVLDAMDDGANRKLCDAMSRRGYKPKAKVSTVVVFGASVGSNYNETCRNAIFIGGDSLPFSSAAPEVAEFRKAYAQYQPGLPLHQWALEAWAIGNIGQDAIESMGPAPTRDGFVKFLNAMKPNNGGGIMTGTAYHLEDYSKPTGKDCFTIARWQDSKGGWVSASSPFPFCFPDAKLYGTKALEQGN